MHYSNSKSEIEYKLTQALLVWSKEGGPKSISIAEAARISKKIDPDIAEHDIELIVKNSVSLDLNRDKIILSSDMIENLPWKNQAK